MYASEDGADPFRAGGHSTHRLRSARGERTYEERPYDSAQSTTDEQQIAGEQTPPPAPLMEASASQMENELDKPLVSSPQHDHPDHGAEQTVRVVTDDAPIYRNTCSRIFIFVLAGIFILAGTGIAALGRIEADHKVLPLCPKCDQFILAMYIGGSSIAAFGLLGLVAAVTRWKLIAFFYAFLLFLISLFCFAVGSGCIVFYFGLSTHEVQTMWTTAINDGDSLVCDVQQQLQCSGLTKCCGVLSPALAVSSANTFCNITTIQEYMDQCDSRCTETNNEYREACEDKVTSLIKAHFAPLIGVSYGLSAIFFAAMVFAIRMALMKKGVRRSLNP